MTNMLEDVVKKAGLEDKDTRKRFYKSGAVSGIALMLMGMQDQMKHLQVTGAVIATGFSGALAYESRDEIRAYVTEKYTDFKKCASEYASKYRKKE
jgi:hypothetical protein